MIKTNHSAELLEWFEASFADLLIMTRTPAALQLIVKCFP